MDHTNEGRLIEFAGALKQLQMRSAPAATAATKTHTTTNALIMEPRTIRHQERVEDLFYLLFKRTGS
jgi:hypothetical protein